MRHLGDVEATEADYETQFSVLVEQEVERRLFQVRFYTTFLCVTNNVVYLISFTL